ncbi:FKBP-type peptidyl-prolyl cis-trans isomerase [Pedobacter nyackensis]|uniref:FKBP-type peptidyl-prolyl cis-trans isomerase n=1 Tax=Pedobacter nyackensis TaxID=475255 RepID=UPI00292F93C6|nr:FKBP-type peptidyl-prolyl cis-trans isomerase [Pedobacter nyackensis]
MKQIKYLVLLVAVAAGLTACKRDSFDTKAQFSADTTAIRKYVTANNIPDVKKDKYGVFYQIITAGSGNTTFTGNTQVTVDYSGKVLGGSQNFDSSAGTPRTFGLGGLIAGWQIGIPYIQKGGKIRLFIPSEFGYGNNGQPGIPANSVLDFTIELKDVQ